ncbi:hypothetical protein Cgig2_018342 [Carnegiea gigantea]|uniref:Ubiquitin-like protease family profile domain-containing protein n=1 Tax=Carnegiea gigantea TaxID=171969 RepID=A0A9Q1QQM7_9CARY|nr:hypothetical protein Cgig2_018342 [Carnegiea gigantea]
MANSRLKMKYTKSQKAMLNNLYKIYLNRKRRTTLKRKYLYNSMLLNFIVYEVVNAIYCIYLFINSEELYELNAHDQAHRLWIDKEAIASMASADSHLENSILDVWSIIMNKKQLTRQTTRPSRFFFTTYAYIAILHAQKPSFKYQEFYRVMQLETQRTNWLDLNTTDLVFFPILKSEHFFLVVFQFADKIVNIIDNLTLPEKPSTRYGDCATLLVQTLLLKVSNPTWPSQSIRIYVKTDYHDNINLHDCGIYTMRHMETYYGDLQSWEHGFEKEKEVFLRTLRAKYAA